MKHELTENEIKLIESYLEGEGFEWGNLVRIQKQGATVYSLLIKKGDIRTERFIDLKYLKQ